MASYAIGDIQGCFYSFQNLLSSLSFNDDKDQLWLTGDLVNRGRGSLEVLNWCYENRKSLKVVLGNHDLHLLALAVTKKKLNSSDSLYSTLRSRKLSNLIEWLLSLPLVEAEDEFFMVHAGILPEWSTTNSIDLSKQVMCALNKNPNQFFKKMYGDEPRVWSPNLDEDDLLRSTINVMTRMRVIEKSGAINFSYKGKLNNLPSNLIPWFNFKRIEAGNFIMTGHWSSIGIVEHEYGVTLDSGCVWGRELTAFNLHTKEIKSVNADSRDLI